MKELDRINLFSGPVKVLLMILISFIVINSFSSSNILAQVQSDRKGNIEDEKGGNEAAKATLQKMGIALVERLGNVGHPGENMWAYSAKIDDLQKAFNKGFGLKTGSPQNGGSIKKGTKISLIVTKDGKIVFYVDSENRVRDDKNQITSIFIDREKLISGVEVKVESFPSILR